MSDVDLIALEFQALKSALALATKRAERAEKWIEEKAVHTPHCKIGYINDIMIPCTCGLSEIEHAILKGRG